MKDAILSRMNRIVAVFMLIVGIVAFATALRDLEFGTVAKPEGGFAPTIFSAGLIIFSVINLFLEFFIKKNVTPEKLKDIDWRKWALYFVICIVYVALIQPVGFLVDTMVCLTVMLKLAGRKGIVKPVLTAVVFTVTTRSTHRRCSGWRRRRRRTRR